MLPLGLRVQEKAERLADKHMRSLGASKLSLSSLTSEALWKQSGRLAPDGAGGSELVRLRSRAKDAFMLSPTHEEEVTAVVADAVRSPKQLPLRLYQVSRKYRDERRPRQGLLRAREFLMKDLYTFDLSEADALATYAQVKKAYNALFTELNVPYIVAEADTGNMGGSLSHEFHFPLAEGEDTVFSCDSCTYSANEELVKAHRPLTLDLASTSTVKSWTALNRNGKGLVTVFHTTPPSQSQTEAGINPHAVKSLLPDLDASNEDPISTWLSHISSATPDSGLDFSITTIIDPSTPSTHATLSPELLFQELLTNRVAGANMSRDDKKQAPVTVTSQRLSATTDLLRVRDGDACPSCRTGKLKSQRAVELGHTFHLGTRYSEPLGAIVRGAPEVPTPLVMGCHGIGVSRMIAAVAAVLRDDEGLNWPSVLAPFQAVVVARPETSGEDVAAVYDAISGAGGAGVAGSQAGGVDVAIDDRRHTLVQKLIDADLVGYPVIVVLGRTWASDRSCEVQCRRKDFKKTVAVEDLYQTVQKLLEGL